MASEDRRKEQRTSIDIRTLPFIGTGEDSRSFEYSLLDTSLSGLLIGMAPAKGAATDSDIKPGDAISLHLALRSTDDIMDQAEIMWIKNDKEQGTLCGIRLRERSEVSISQPYHLSLSLETSDIVIETESFDSADSLFLSLIDESLTMKRRIRSALEGIPAFGKHSSSREDTLSDLKGMMDSSCSRLQVFRNAVVKGTTSPTAGHTGELADLRTVVRSDVYARLKRILGPEQSVPPAFDNIRKAEHQLFVNHNTLVLLWFGYLAYMYQNI